ncbi:hypothetical protein [Devosia sp.]|uniref:hypothetical protein n=1 Tax=Devosia sp. TaxID=1871048 RepID=UPI001AFE3F94|nr:hypothetical protein [Devosia sp.]MBO9591137.1 hypothetical protein [Devosia sp.]
MSIKSSWSMIPVIGNQLCVIVYIIVSVPLLVIFPTLHAISTNADPFVYGGLIACSILLFILPCLYISSQVSSRFLAPMAKPSSKSHLPIILFITGVAIYAIAFSYFTFSYDLFFRRVGFAGLVERSMRIPFYGLIIHRSFMENAVTLTCALAFLLVLTPMPRITRVYAAFVLIATFLLYSSFVLSNNRFQSGILFVCICLAVAYSWPKKWNRFYLALVIGGIAALSAYSFKVTENIRTEIYLSGHVTPIALNPLLSTRDIYEATKSSLDDGEATDLMKQLRQAEASGMLTDGQNPAVEDVLAAQIERPLKERLNGLDLMAQITRPAFERGFGWGRFWVQPISLYYYYFADQEKFLEMKEELRTNPKVYIASFYLGKEIDDIPSSILTDSYANFSIFAFPAVAIIIGVLLGGVNTTLRSTTSAGAALLAFFVLEKALYVEKEMFALIIDLVKFSPVPLVAAWLLWHVPIKRDNQPR